MYCFCCLSCSYYFNFSEYAIAVVLILSDFLKKYVNFYMLVSYWTCKSMNGCIVGLLYVQYMIHFYC